LGLSREEIAGVGGRRQGGRRAGLPAAAAEVMRERKVNQRETRTARQRLQQRAGAIATATDETEAGEREIERYGRARATKRAG